MTFSKNKSHKLLFAFGVIIFFMFLIYVYVCEHKISIEKYKWWTDVFSRNGFTNSQIKNITHDNSIWYYKRKSTCVAYSEDDLGKCDKSEHYCSGDHTYGSRDLQVKNIKKAIDNGGEHPKCPLIYIGAD